MPLVFTFNREQMKWNFDPLAKIVGKHLSWHFDCWCAFFFSGNTICVCSHYYIVEEGNTLMSFWYEIICVQETPNGTNFRPTGNIWLWSSIVWRYFNFFSWKLNFDLGNICECFRCKKIRRRCVLLKFVCQVTRWVCIQSFTVNPLEKELNAKVFHRKLF